MIREKYQKRVKETSINIAQTKVEAVRKKDIVKTGYRVYKDGFIGVSGTIGEHSEDEMLKRAEEALSLQIPYECEATKNHKESLIFDKEIIPEADLVKEVEEVLEELRSKYPGFIFLNKINMGCEEVSLSNDANLDLYYKSNYIQVGLIIKDKSKSNVFDAFTGFSGRKYDRGEFLRFTDEILTAYNNVIELPKQKSYPVIFSTDDYLPFRKFVTDLNGLSFGSKSSLFSDSLGKKVFNESFTLYQSTNSNELITPFFDAEGKVNENYRYPLIKNGVITAPYTDKKTAVRFGLPHTGSAAAEYDGIPTLQLTSIEVEPSEKTIKELLGGQPAIFIMMASGGDFTPDGSFGSPVQLAMMFDGEKLIGRLPEFQISSHVYKMFGDDFIGVSKDKTFSLSDDRFMVMEMDISK
jgi:PmbA protein